MESREKPGRKKETTVKKKGNPNKSKKETTEKQLSPKEKNTRQLEKELQEREESRKQIQIAIEWLCQTFPECFNFKKPIPLKRRIEKDIFPFLPKDDSISKTILKAAIVYYTRNIRYQKAVNTYKHRFDLEGNIVDTVKTSDKEYAKKRIAWVEDKIRKASMPDKTSK